MPRIKARIVLPYLLKLPDGPYPTSPGGETLIVYVPPHGTPPRTAVIATFDHPDTRDPDEKYRHKARDAEQLLARTNRLLRWYRVAAHQPEVIELTRAQASPFQFLVVGRGDRVGWTEPIEHKPAAGPTTRPRSIPGWTATFDEGLSSGRDPSVADLFLLDAELAMHEGRFREAVLFCWSTIDASFNQKFDALVDRKLAGEWADAREFFKGPDFGLRNKMSAAMHLVAGRSLFREPGDFWRNLSSSYRKRNGIIHRGEVATEDDARMALDVAQALVRIMEGF